MFQLDGNVAKENHTFLPFKLNINDIKVLDGVYKKLKF